MTLEEIRAQYPQYKEVPDDKLAKALYNKYYSDRATFEEFSNKLGYTQPQAQQQEPEQSVEQDERTWEEIVAGGAEAAMAVGSGAISDIVGSVAALQQAGTGGFAQSGRTREQIIEGGSYQPQSEAGQEYTAALGSIFDKIGRAAKYAPSKLISALSAPFTDKTMKEIDEIIMSAPIAETAGGAVEEATGIPDIGSTVEGAVGLAAGAVPAGTVGAVAGRGAQAIQRGAESRYTQQAQDLARQQTGQEPGGVGIKGVQQATQRLQKAEAKDVAQMVQADPKIMQAIDSLEIEAEPVFAQISQNPQYREIEGGLRAMPGSELNAQANQFITAVRNKADELIETFGGVKDKALLSQQFESDTLKTIDDIKQAESEIYGQLDDAVVKSERAVPQSSVDFLYQKADELGGVENLDPKLKKLMRELEENPTIGLINQRRKDIGEAMRTQGKTFSDQESGLLKTMYGRLTDDMNQILEEKGMKDISDAAKQLTIERKTLEGNMQSLLGKNLQKDLSAIVGSALKGLPKGRAKQFTETINKIPKEYRQKAVVSALNDVFKGTGQGMEGFNANDYLKFWNNLQRQPAARTALFKELPKGSRGALAGLAEISKGINQADRTVIRTGIIQSFFEPNTGLVSKMLGNAGRALAATKAGPAGSALYSAASDLLSQSTSPSRRVAELIASPQFQTTVKRAINERVTNPQAASKELKAAEERLKKTAKYKQWVETLPESDKIAANAGLLTYLTTVGEQNGTSNDNQQ